MSKPNPQGHLVLHDLEKPIYPGPGEFEIHHTALKLWLPEKKLFRHNPAMSGSNGIDARPRGVAAHDNVRAGNNRFRRAACHGGDTRHKSSPEVAVVLLPHFWQTWWFVALAAIGLLGLCAALIRYAILRKVHRRLERLEQQHAIAQERTRIAQDMHDDLGARLTGIMLLSDMLEHNRYDPALNDQLQKIRSSCREMVQNLDNIVWAVDPGNDSLEATAVYIYEYVERFLKGSPIRSRLDVPNQLPIFYLSSEMRHNLFMAVKEALNNAVKHSQASEIRFSLNIKESVLQLTIEDDGGGFLRPEKSGMGNGLSNMENRLHKIGGQFDCSSHPGKGTRISLGVSLRKGEKR